MRIHSSVVKAWRWEMSSSRSRLGIWMGVSFTILNGESSGPRFLPFGLGRLAFLLESSKMSSSGSTLSSGRRYSMRMMHQMPPMRIFW